MSASNGARAWRALYELMQSQKGWVAERLAGFDLTLPLGHAMHLIAENGELTMSALAATMFCDASNATGTVDRLVARGLVERLPSERDRRVKVVRLTPAGKRLQKRVDGMLMAGPPPAIARLSAADQRTLREILERAMALCDGGDAVRHPA